MKYHERIWKVLADNCQGVSHRNQNIPCQDAFRFSTFGSSGECLAIAVSDGAGSALYADIGSTIACNELIHRVIRLHEVDLINCDVIMNVLNEVREILMLLANKICATPRELACTILLAVIGRDESVFVQIGDGSIVIEVGDQFRTVGWPQKGEYANTTNFLTDENWFDKVQFEHYKGEIRSVAVLSDGLEGLALDYTNKNAYQPFFQTVFAHLRSVHEIEDLIEPFRAFLNSSNVNERTEDDKTLVLATYSQ